MATTIDLVTWEREDWRNAGHASRWHCNRCNRFGPFDVSTRAVIKAAQEHDKECGK